MDARATLSESCEPGCSMLEAGQSEAALAYFRTAFSQNPGNARIRSYLGLCVGLVERRFDQSRELCQVALDQEFFNPELYLNMARVHLCFGFKSEAIRYLRRGKMIDPANLEIQQALAGLGPRRRQVLGFLPRRHVLNRLLGSVCHWVGSTVRRRIAA